MGIKYLWDTNTAIYYLKWILRTIVYHLFHSIVYQSFSAKFTRWCQGGLNYFSPKFTTLVYFVSDITSQSLPLAGIC